jgi:hypothetical protein
MRRQIDYPTRIVILLALSAAEGSLFSMSRRSSFYPALPGSVCSDSAASVTFQPANAVFASCALRRDLLTCESHLPHALLLPFLATRHSPLATVPKSFICHTSAKSAVNSFPCHTSKNSLPQVQSLPHLPPPHPGPRRRSTVSSRAPAEGSAFAFALFLLPFTSFSGASHVQTKVLSVPYRPR